MGETPSLLTDRAKKKENKMTPSEVKARIIWTLKLDGDINENHKNGNAYRTLMERMQARGCDTPSAKMSNSLRTLYNNKTITKLTSGSGSGSHTLAIRLNPDATLPPNPFGDDLEPMKGELVPYESSVDSILNGYRALPVSTRLELIAALSASVKEDMEKVRSAL